MPPRLADVIELFDPLNEPIAWEVADLIQCYGLEAVKAEVAMHEPLRAVE